MVENVVNMLCTDTNTQIISVKSAKNPIEPPRNTKIVLKPQSKKNEYVSKNEIDELKKNCKNPKTFAKTLYNECKTRKRLGYCSDKTELDLDYSKSETHKFLFITYTKDAEYTYHTKSGDTAASVRQMFGLKNGALLKCNKWIVDANHPFDVGTPIYFLEKDIKDKW